MKIFCASLSLSPSPSHPPLSQAYNIYIQQLKEEKDDLEHEPPLKSVVRPQIKQPGAGAAISVGKGAGGLSPQGPRIAGRHGDDVASNSSSFEDMRDGTDSNQTSPVVDQKGLLLNIMIHNYVYHFGLARQKLTYCVGTSNF